MSLEELLSDMREQHAQEPARRKTKRRRKNPASTIREDAYYREITDLLRTMPSDWRRQYRSGKDKLSAIGGPVLPAGTSAASAPTPEQAMLLIGITAGGNPSKDTPFGPHKVPKAVREAAMKGIRLSHANNYGAWDFIGLARAIELVIVPSVSDTTFKRMGKYLFRHKKDARASGFGDDENPSRGYMAWLNWGGDPAVKWTGAFETNPRKERTRAEKTLDVARTGHTVTRIGMFASKKAAPQIAARAAATTAGRFGARAVPVVGEVLMVAGAGKEAFKAGRRRYKEGWRSGSVTRDAAKVAAGAFGLEDFIPDAPAKKNPLVFDNRFEPEPMKRYPRSRVVASIVAPPRQRAQVERLADSPHTFRVIVLDTGEGLDAKTLPSLSKPGSITLVTGLDAAAKGDATPRDLKLGKGARLGTYSAFTFLHRLGDVLYEILQAFVLGKAVEDYAYPFGLMLFRRNRGEGRVYIPAEKLSQTTLDFGQKIHDAFYMSVGPKNEMRLWSEGSLSKYIVHHTNSHMARAGLRFESEGGALDFLNMSQCIADWLALSEMPSARARPGRGEPWLLFPPGPESDVPPATKRRIRTYVGIINTYFPLFAQSLLDDLDGAVFRI